MDGTFAKGFASHVSVEAELLEVAQRQDTEDRGDSASLSLESLFSAVSHASAELEETVLPSMEGSGLASDFYNNANLSFTSESRLRSQAALALSKKLKRLKLVTKMTGASDRGTEPRPFLVEGRVGLAPSSTLHVHMRPGLSIQWRRARAFMACFLRSSPQRQHRITKFVKLLSGLTGFSFVRMVALSVGFVLAHSLFHEKCQ